MHVRYTDVLKLYDMSLDVKYFDPLYMWDILMFWNRITCHSMYNILFQYVCEIIRCSETVTCHSMYNILFQYTYKIYRCSVTVSHVTPCTIFCFNIHVRYTDVLKLYHMSLLVQYSVSIYVWDILMFWNCNTSHTMCNTLFNIHVRYTDVLKVYHISLLVQYCFNIRMRYTDVLKLYHISLHVQYSVSIYMSDIQMFWNCITCHSMYNILFQYTCELYWCSETVSHATPCTIFCLNIHVRYIDVLKLYHIPLHIQYTASIYIWDIVACQLQTTFCLLQHNVQ